MNKMIVINYIYIDTSICVPGDVLAASNAIFAALIVGKLNAVPGGILVASGDILDGPISDKLIGVLG